MITFFLWKEIRSNLHLIHYLNFKNLIIKIALIYLFYIKDFILKEIKILILKRSQYDSH